jgi:hypothetical protein
MLGASVIEQGTVSGCYEDGNESSYFLKDTEILHQTDDY